VRDHCLRRSNMGSRAAELSIEPSESEGFRVVFDYFGAPGPGPLARWPSLSAGHGPNLSAWPNKAGGLAGTAAD
jgi:hypothetical protein